MKAALVASGLRTRVDCRAGRKRARHDAARDQPADYDGMSGLMRGHTASTACAYDGPPGKTTDTVSS
jgi:hypothetical protein